ncbi:unnamed protein product [Moneuplotes crassus]|uniref:Mitochondrial import inner membrane translocase subunit TIM50 n=1 Tax=Euplotes crassus TaxID=5936 RepID=A0AAD1U1E0_EUPCR|nr:unnamed protein product [Moneuplotes crassus]
MSWKLDIKKSNSASKDYNKHKLPLHRTYTGKIGMGEQERSLSSNFSDLDIQEGSTARIRLGNIRNSSKYFSERTLDLESQTERRPVGVYKVGADNIPRMQRKNDRGKKTLVLDLDETLVHTIGDFDDYPAGCKPFTLLWNVKKKGKLRKATATTFIRPGAFNFLKEVTQMFEVIFFTAATEKYAREVTKLLDRDFYKPYLLTRKDCIFRDGMFIKDLSIIPRNLKDVIIIDNLSESYLHHPDNGLPIPSWVCDPQDEAFDKILTVLQILNKANDVRPLIRKCVTNEKILLYKLYEISKNQKKSSPSSRSNNLIKGFNKGTTALLSISEKDSTKDNSKINNSELDNQENSINGTTQRYKRRMSIAKISQNFSLVDSFSSNSICDLRHKNYKKQSYTPKSVKRQRADHPLNDFSAESPKRLKPSNVKLSQKKLISGIEQEPGILNPRVTMQPRARHPLLNFSVRSYKRQQTGRQVYCPKRHAHSLAMINQKPEENSKIFKYVKEDSEVSYEDGGTEELIFY